MRGWLAFGVLIVVGVLGPGVRAVKARQMVARGYGRDLEGHAVTMLGEAGARAVVLYFVASDCPISNRTFPEMRRVREEFHDKGVRFWFVYANAGEEPVVVRAHQRDYDAGGEVILDVDGMLARMTGAKVTPEAAVLTLEEGRWVTRYVGRVDDRYARLGVERPQASEHFVERVVREVLDGRPVEKATGEPIGCGIVSPVVRASAGSER